MARNPLTPFGSGFGTPGGSDPFLSLHRQMNRLFDDVLRGTGLPAATGNQGQGRVGNFVNASMNVSETENEIRITAELPGVTEQDIDVSLDDDVLTIRGEKKFERTDDKENSHFVERSYGTFQRSLRLPFPVDPERVQGSFENGVLTVDRAEDRATGALPPHPGAGPQLRWSGFSGRSGRVRRHRWWRQPRRTTWRPGSTPGASS
jgi:HSP20 family protein